MQAAYLVAGNAMQLASGTAGYGCGLFRHWDNFPLGGKGRVAVTIPAWRRSSRARRSPPAPAVAAIQSAPLRAPARSGARRCAAGEACRREEAGGGRGEGEETGEGEEGGVSVMPKPPPLPKPMPPRLSYGIGDKKRGRWRNLLFWVFFWLVVVFAGVPLSVWVVRELPRYIRWYLLLSSA